MGVLSCEREKANSHASPVYLECMVLISFAEEKSNRSQLTASAEQVKMVTSCLIWNWLSLMLCPGGLPSPKQQAICCSWQWQYSALIYWIICLLRYSTLGSFGLRNCNTSERRTIIHQACILRDTRRDRTPGRSNSFKINQWLDIRSKLSIQGDHSWYNSL